MTMPVWRDLFVNPGQSTMCAPSSHGLEIIQNAADQLSPSLLSGLSAIGELIVHTANAGELDKSLAHDVGWLIRSLAELQLQLNETGLSARHQLRHDTPSFKSTSSRLKQGATA